MPDIPDNFWELIESRLHETVETENPLTKTKVKQATFAALYGSRLEAMNILRSHTTQNPGEPEARLPKYIAVDLAEAEDKDVTTVTNASMAVPKEEGANELYPIIASLPTMDRDAVDHRAHMQSDLVDSIVALVSGVVSRATALEDAMWNIQAPLADTDTEVTESAQEINQPFIFTKGPRTMPEMSEATVARIEQQRHDVVDTFSMVSMSHLNCRCTFEWGNPPQAGDDVVVNEYVDQPYERVQKPEPFIFAKGPRIIDV